MCKNVPAAKGQNRTAAAVVFRAHARRTIQAHRRTTPVRSVIHTEKVRTELPITGASTIEISRTYCGTKSTSGVCPCATAVNSPMLNGK